MCTLNIQYFFFTILPILNIYIVCKWRFLSFLDQLCLLEQSPDWSKYTLGE